MRTRELKAYLAANEDESAYGLLHDADPNLIKRFNRVCRTMKTLMEDVNKHFPEATYYTASGGFNIILGLTHGDADGNGSSANSELCAVGDTTGLNIGDGDW